MYRSYSPSESNQVAVVPRSSSFSPSAFHGSPTSAFADDFGCSPPPKRPRNCVPTTSASAFTFAEFADLIADSSSAPLLYSSSSSLSPPTPFSSDSPSYPAATDGYQPSGFDAIQQQQQCEDSKVDLANFLQSVEAMQHQQQQAQQQRQGRLAPGMDITTPALSEKDYSIVVHQEPEEYYRARYETEGIRGPMKGRENNHPAVKIVGPMTYSGTVRVSLVHEDGSKHGSCFLDETKDRQKALSKKIDPQSNMIVEFEDLRIRRETKSKNYSKEGGRKADKAKSARNDKTACLRFVATLQLAPDREIKVQVLSKPIQLCAPPEGAELEWLIPEYGHANGDEKIVIKGTKMTCPKVTFTVMLPDTQVVELLGHVDKEQSHQV
ncbi:hypothetical protein GBAR_LOCUS19968 [Geodia barretti]|uniref:RHD domain-containing protein n=1 Tax=Geodia barretti TaxID=519541 RepID=A0AA35STK5_GEOBA|nr:hypothetical protein GBAR_LOCUS19968 [Geodia barretti]